MLVYDTGVKMILVLIMEVMGAHSGPPFVTPNTGMFFFFSYCSLEESSKTSSLQHHGSDEDNLDGSGGVNSMTRMRSFRRMSRWGGLCRTTFSQNGAEGLRLFGPVMDVGSTMFACSNTRLGCPKLLTSSRV